MSSTSEASRRTDNVQLPATENDRLSDEDMLRLGAVGHAGYLPNRMVFTHP
jgi:hypothetical protein